MSDHIEHEGKTYYESSYLELANQNAARRDAEIARLRTENEQLRQERDAAVEDAGRWNGHYERTSSKLAHWMGRAEGAESALTAMQQERDTLLVVVRDFVREIRPTEYDNGQSTSRELAHAQKLGKLIRFLEPTE